MFTEDSHKELLKLNLGCGLNAPSGWINIDASFTAKLSKWKWFYIALCKIMKIKPTIWPKNIMIVDVRNGLPFPDNSIWAIFSSHMLEHMNYEEANFVIKECYRVLCKDGVIRIIVPDLYQITKRYIDLITHDPKGEHSQNYLKDLGIQEPSQKGIKKVIFKIFSHSTHKHIYDEWSLKELLEKHGFININRKVYGQSNISDIKRVEDKERHELSVCLEGVKQY